MRRPALLPAVLAALVCSPFPAPPAARAAQVGLLELRAEPGAEPALDRLAGRARAIVAQIESDLGARPSGPFRMILIPARGATDAATKRLDALAPPWATGYLFPERRLGVIRVARAGRYPYGTLESVLAHEATHMVIHDAAGGRVPLWFNEGVATLEGRRWRLEDMILYTRLLLTSDLPGLAELDPLFGASEGEARLAYAGSFAFVSWNVRRHGSAMVRDVLSESRQRAFPEAWRVATGRTLERSEADWRGESLLRYRWIPILTASSTLWIVIAALAVAAGIRRRSRLRRLREQWLRQEADEEASPHQRSVRPGP